jgi:quercetin dioxygenase-like cupin family protein
MKVISKDEVREFKIFRGVTGKILLSGEKIMFNLVEIEKGGFVPPHRHDNEQFGLCLGGKAEFKGEDRTEIVQNGMFYALASNELHSVQMIGDEPGLFLDVFSPPREDYLKMMRQAVK